ncbi:dof zinc finger protein DOF2.1-like isoform X2 [Canna indica]|uniref:Dof zinc finger protein DOF2.1-like isoform X2 n=1 Tax=Canna indica TaxID=4628 RepID=A0AAQ3KDV5_9LILI|nr:dof zinc finger protein DOF2.1-like isoform X2 [Canna indica]
MEVSDAHLHQVAMANLPLEEVVIGCPNQAKQQQEEEEKEEKKNKKSSSSSSSSSSKTTRPPQLDLHPFLNPISLPPLLAYDPNDLTFALASLQKQQLPGLHLLNPNNSNDHHEEGSSFLLGNPSHHTFLDMLRTDNLYCGSNMDEEVVTSSTLPPLGGGGGGGGFAAAGATSATTVTTHPNGEDEDRMSLQWQQETQGDYYCNMGLDSGRDHDHYSWNGSNWQSLINSSLM